MEKLEPNIFRHEQIMARALFEEMVLKGGCNFEMAANVLGTLPKGDPDRDSLENVLNFCFISFCLQINKLDSRHFNL